MKFYNYYCLIYILLPTCNAALDTTPLSVEAEFKKYKIVPDIIDEAPNDYLTVIYPNGRHVNLGNTFSPVELVLKPYVNYLFNATDLYALVFVEPDRPHIECLPETQMLHWLVINIPGNDLNSGYESASYFPPLALPVGIFRYTFLLMRQTSKLDTTSSNIVSSLLGRLCFNTREFMKKKNMDLIAGNFFVPNKSLNSINILGLEQ